MIKYFVGFLLYGVLFLASCTDPNIIGLEVQSPSDNITVTFSPINDSLNLSTISEDSLRSDNPNFLLLGNLSDNIFGKSSAEFAAQFSLPYNDINFGNSNDLIVDSVVLSLSYAGSYGNNHTIDISVHEILEDLNIDDMYYSNHEIAYDFNPIFDNTCNLNLEDSIFVGDEFMQAHLRLKLDNLIGRKILDASGTSNLSTNSEFLEFFKGLYVKANQGTSILYFNPTSSNSNLTIYYRDIVNQDSLFIQFFMTNDVEKINIFSPSDSLSHLADTRQFSYIQSMSGYKILVEIPDVNSLKTFFQDKIINHVSVSFQIETSDVSNFLPHNRLYLVRLDNNGQDYFLIDYILEGEEHFGGTLEGEQYKFNITRYFQRLLNNNSYTNKLYLVASGAAINANRTVLINKETKFNVIYTEF